MEKLVIEKNAFSTLPLEKLTISAQFDPLIEKWLQKIFIRFL